MRVAIAGTAHSHPFSDARNLAALGATVAALWDADDPARSREFVAEFGAPVVAAARDLRDHDPDLIIVTTRPERTASVIREIAGAGLPCFLNKTIATSHQQLTALDAAVSAYPGPIFSSSVLRFAPAVMDFAEDLRGRDLLALRCEVRHDIEVFLGADRAWQDDPRGAGGTLINMGIHSWEMADTALGGLPLTVVGARAARSARSRTRSEDLGVVLAETPDARPVTIDVVGAPGPALYRMEATTATGPVAMEIAGGDPMLKQGFVGLAGELIRFVERGVPAVSWERTRAIYRTAIIAARTARAHGAAPLAEAR